MGIVVLILKIIGIVLLVLLGVLLLTALLVLFFPISYRLNASYRETPEATGKVWWLFHLISVTLYYDKDEKHCILRLLGIPLADFLNPKPKQEKKQKKKKQKSAKKKRQKKKSEKTAREAQTQPETRYQPENKRQSDTATRIRSEDEHPSEGTAGIRPQTGRQEDGRQSDTAARMQPEAASREADKKGFWQRGAEKCRALREQGLNLKQKLEKWVEILSRDKTKSALEQAKLQIIRLLKHLLPRKWSVYLQFGFDDPATTGKLLGYYWMFIGLWGGHVVCVPDFEHQILLGKIDAKGHIRLFWLLYAAYHFLFDQELVYLRKLKSELDSN